MTLTLQEMSDRMEIADTLVRYVYGLDQRLPAQWGAVFTPDAAMDFAPAGSGDRTTAQMWAVFTANDAALVSSQHLVTDMQITIEGDVATARSEYLVTIIANVDDSTVARTLTGGVYDDELVRTPDGWRISRKKATSKSRFVDRYPRA
jgi:hypothetical protein